jgi:FkbM family methyltransferase
MKNKFFKLLCKLITKLIKTNFGLEVFNKVYETSGQKWINIFHKYVKFPNKSFTWDIKLLNKKKVKTHIIKEDYKTLQFAIDYKWYSPGIARIENEILESLGKDCLYIDIGANLGMRSLIALSNAQQTLMFEPNNDVSDINENRCKLNNFTNYKIIRKGISNNNGQVTFNIDSSSYKSSINDNIETEFIKSEIIETISLDSYVKENSIISKDILIKVDIEGHETEMISGAIDVIKSLSPTLIIEINDKSKNFNVIFETLVNFNYECFALYSDRWSGKLLNKIDSVEDIKSINEVTDFLFVKNQKIKESIKQYL